MNAQEARERAVGMGDIFLCISEEADRGETSADLSGLSVSKTQAVKLKELGYTVTYSEDDEGDGYIVYWGDIPNFKSFGRRLHNLLIGGSEVVV